MENVEPILVTSGSYVRVSSSLNGGYNQVTDMDVMRCEYQRREERDGNWVTSGGIADSHI